MNASFKSLEKKIAYHFENGELLKMALTHRSVSGKFNNERLEFLGDAILGSVVSSELLLNHINASEGHLSHMRSQIVCGESLSKVSKDLQLGDYVILGVGEMRSGGHRRSSILANCVEAIIGAIFLDSNYDRCQKVVVSLFADAINSVDMNKIEKDAKTQLQEHMQALKLELPIYEIVSISGEDHKQTFKISCSILNGKEVFCAEGGSRKEAEKKAAKSALAVLKEMKEK